MPWCSRPGHRCQPTVTWDPTEETERILWTWAPCGAKSIGIGFSLLIIEGSLEAKLPTIWTDGKAQPGRNSDVEKVIREKMQVREKVGKSRNTVFFQCFVAPGVEK